MRVCGRQAGLPASPAPKLPSFSSFLPRYVTTNPETIQCVRVAGSHCVHAANQAAARPGPQAPHELAKVPRYFLLPPPPAGLPSACCPSAAAALSFSFSLSAPAAPAFFGSSFFTCAAHPQRPQREAALP